MNKHLGIDVSSHNGTINWDKVINDGVEFAIIRIGFGGDIPKQDDLQAIKNMKECEKRNIPYGVYIYSYAIKESDVDSEVKHTLRVIKGFKPTLGVFFDMEDADGYKVKHGLNPYQNKEKLTNFCLKYCELIEKNGYKAGVYASLDYFRNILDKNKLSKYMIWLAQWGVKKPAFDCLIWQYADNGKVNGSSTKTDMNYYFGNLPNKNNNQESNKEEKPSSSSQNQKYKYSIGQEVIFSTCYKSSKDSISKAINANKMIRNHGKITKIVNERNPYLLDNGLCWVNDGDIRGLYNSNIKKGDKVKVINAISYEGKPFKLFYKEYDVIQVNNDRAVIGIGKTVTSSINIKNIQKI